MKTSVQRFVGKVQNGNVGVHFADIHRNHNYACLTTQVVTEDLKRVSTLVEAPSLSDEKIKELVRKVATDADALLGQFDGEMFAICRVPFQLELVVEIWAATRAFPRDLDGLYFHVLGPLVDKEAWTLRGHGDWPDVLSALAFGMMTGKRPYDPQKDYLPDELKSELVGRKLLVERGEVLEFRHDRIRAYLAAKYFSLRWRKILTDEKTVMDPNWDVMLQFHLMVGQNENQARDLLFLIVKRDMDAAIRLSSWGRENRSELFKNWQDDFSREIGRRVLGEADNTEAR